MTSKYKGYTGKVLDINLTTNAIGEYPESVKSGLFFCFP